MARFQMQAPDGHTYEFEAPDNATDDDAAAYFKKQWEIQYAPKKEAPADPRSTLRQAGDLGLEFGASVAESAQFAASAFNPTLRGGEEAVNFIRSGKSDFAQERTKRFEKERADVTDEGFFAGIGERAQQIYDAPGDTAAKILGGMVLPLGAGSIGLKIAKGLGLKAPGKIGLRTAAVTSGTIGAGLVRENYFKTVMSTPDAELVKFDNAYRALRERGFDEKVAKQMVATHVSQSLASGMALQAAIDSVAMFWGGAEKVLLQGAKGGAKAAAKTLTKESTGETASGSAEALSTNIAVKEVLPETPVLKGVGTAGVEGGALGGVAGAAGHVGARIIHKDPKAPPGKITDSDVEAFENKGTPDPAKPTKVQIPLYPTPVTQEDGSVRAPVDQNPVMVEVEVGSAAHKAYLAEQGEGQLELPFTDKVQQDPQQTEQMDLFENTPPVPTPPSSGPVGTNIMDQPNLPGVAQFGLSQDTQRNPAPLNRGLMDAPAQIGPPDGDGPPSNDQAANRNLQSDPTGTADLKAAGMDVPAANQDLFNTPTGQDIPRDLKPTPTALSTSNADDPGALPYGAPADFVTTPSPTGVDAPLSSAEYEKQINDHYEKNFSLDASQEFNDTRDKLMQQKIAAEKREKAQKKVTSYSEVFPGFKNIKQGTKVEATSGIKYKEPTVGTVVGSKTVRLDDKVYNLPVVDFGDGEPRAILPGNVSKVFGPRNTPSSDTLAKVGSSKAGASGAAVLNSISGKSPEAAFASLAKNASNPRLGYIFERIGMLMNVLTQQGIEIKVNGVSNLNLDGIKASGTTQYNFPTKTITVAYERTKIDALSLENTLAHEGLHAVTGALVEANKNAQWREANPELSKRISELENLFKMAKIGLRDMALGTDLFRHATSNLHEFIAYGLTSPGMMRALRNMKSETNSNRLMDFLRGIGNLLGFRPNDFHLYSELFSIFDSIAKHPDISKGYKEAFKLVKKLDPKAEYAELLGLSEYTPESVQSASESMRKSPWDIDFSKVGQKLRSGIRHLMIATNHPMIKAAHTSFDRAMSEKRDNLRRIIGKDKTSLLMKKYAIPQNEMADVRKALLIADKVQRRIEYDDFPNLSEASKKFIQAHQDELAKVLEYHNEKARLSDNKEITAREGYSPSTFGGRFRALITTTTDGKMTPIGYVGEMTTVGYEKAIKWVKQNHPGATITKLPDRQSKSLKDAADLETFVQMVQQVYGDVSGDLLEAARQMDNTLFGMDKREKKKLGIWGNEGNKPWAQDNQNNDEFFNAVFNYYDEAYTHAALQPAMKEVREMNREFIDSAPNAVREIEAFMKHMTGRNLNATGEYANYVVDNVMHFIENNAEKLGMKMDVGRGTSILRDQLTSLALGWFNTQYLAAQLIQPLQTALPFAQMVVDRYGISSLNIVRAVSTGGLQFGAFVTNQKLSPETQEIINFATANGLTGQSHLEHKSAINKSKINRKIDDMGGMVIQWGETLTRLPMFLTFVDLIKNSPQGRQMDLRKIMDIAKNLTQYSMVDYNPEQRPQIYSELGFAGSLMGTFRTYQHGNISQMITLGREAKSGNPIPLLLMMTVLFGLAGSQGLPIFEEANDVAKLAGVNLREWMMKNLPPEANKGYLSELSGFDLSSKYAFNRVVPDQFPVAHAQQVWKPLVAAFELINNDVIRNGTVSPGLRDNLVREILPSSAKNIFDTYRIEDTPRGPVIRKKDGTAGVSLTEDDVQKRHSLTGIALQAKPLKESMRRTMDFENARINMTNDEAKARITADFKRFFGQGILTKSLMEDLAKEYIERGGEPKQLLSGIKNYMSDRDLPVVLRGIDRGKASVKKLQALDNPYR